MSEIRTCEEYVFAELERLEAENGRLRAQVENLREELAKPHEVKHEVPSKCREYAAEGRKAVADTAVVTYRGNAKSQTYEEWLVKVIDHIPSWTSRDDLVRDCDTELRAIYEKEREC